ncbi:MAG: hypothetical protein ACRCZE_02900 [Candidatus Altimarinota bacterium]
MWKQLIALVLVAFSGNAIGNGASQPVAAEQNLGQSGYLEEAFESTVVEGLGVENEETVKIDENFKNKLAKLGVTLHPGTDFAEDSVYNPISELHCSSLVYRVLTLIPKETADHLKNLTFYFNDTGRRGLGGGSTIILRCQNVSDRELVSVFMHELGHIYDTGVLKGNFWAGESEFMDGKNPVYRDDLSLDFYRISYKDDKTLKATASNLDFVSGYAMSDPFEDFGESYNFYVLHGDDFRYLAVSNEALKQKYDFFKNNIFAGQEFDLKDGLQVGDEANRSYDSTLLHYDLEAFLDY